MLPQLFRDVPCNDDRGVGERALMRKPILGRAFEVRISPQTRVYDLQFQNDQIKQGT